MKPQSVLREPASGYRNFLIALLILRICSYFMLSDSIMVVQAMKAGLRAGLSLVMLAAVLYHLREHNKQTFRMHQPISVWMYGVYLIFGMASLLWTSSFDVSLLQLLMDIEGFAFSFLYIYLITIYRQRHPGGYFDLHKLLAPAILFIGLGFLVGLFLDPDRFYRLTHGGAVSRLGGFIINPNELGMLLVIGIACYLPLLVKEGRVRVSVILSLLLLIQLLLLTGSRSAFIGLLAVVLVYGLTNGSRSQRTLIFLGGIALIPLAGWSFFVKQDQLTEIYTLTGRLPFWRDLLTYNFPREAWFGYGYMRIDYADKFESLNAYAGAMTHNTFLQVLLGLGMTGLLLVLIQLSAFLWTVKQVADKKYRMVVGLIFIPLFVNSLTEFGIFGETNYGILFYLFLVFTAALEPQTGIERKNASTFNETSEAPPYRSPAFT
ncbi:MAG: O-antigen ligase family protein [Bacteroidetes bacterium]|nr:O-antigen ligase family protein [Bacteroidota bacterium]